MPRRVSIRSRLEEEEIREDVIKGEEEGGVIMEDEMEEIGWEEVEEGSVIEEDPEEMVLT